MREIRKSGSEGGGTGYSTGPPYPYQQNYSGQVLVQPFEVLPHLIARGPSTHQVVLQVLVMPSQVTESVPTVQTLAPVHEIVWLPAEQNSSHGRGGGQVLLSEQALLQVKVAVHCADAAVGSSRARPRSNRA